MRGRDGAMRLCSLGLVLGLCVPGPPWRVKRVCSDLAEWLTLFVDFLLCGLFWGGVVVLRGSGERFIAMSGFESWKGRLR